MTTERKLELGGIPVVVVEPVGTPSRLVLWQTHLGGSATRLLPHLHRLAEQGCRAVSFDPPEHGARAAAGDARAFSAYVLERFRLRMWPILGIATLDALRVLDATADSSITTIAAGGISMGGDIAIALAGIDDRVSRVAVTGSTPDWTRPGMRRIDSPDIEIDQGEANRHGQWLRDHLDPMLHLDRFRHGVPIEMHCGGEDHHVPEANAHSFRAALGGDGDAVTVTRHPGLDHIGVCTDEQIIAACLAHLADPSC
jgi:uncharacterized protein